MDFVFGCWSHVRSSVDCRAVTDRMAVFFEQQRVPHLQLFPFGPNFAAGVASFITDTSKLAARVVETDAFIAVGDVTLYETPERHPDDEAVPVGAAPDLLAVARARCDPDRLARLNGDFAAVVYDKGPGTLTMVNDHCGIVPLHYAHHGGACAFSSLVRPLLRAPWATNELDDIALATYLAMMAPGRERTFYASAKTLLPASRLTIGEHAQAESRKYWVPHPAPGLKVSGAEEAYEAVREQLVRAVLSRARGLEGLGLKLSGGLDSSTIAGILCTEFPDREFKAVTRALKPGHSNPLPDEREYIAHTTARYPNLRVAFETVDDTHVLDGAAYWWTWHAGPVGDLYFYADHALTRRAGKIGVRWLLSGDGGDYGLSMKAHGFLVESFRGLHVRRVRDEIDRIRNTKKLRFSQVIRAYLLPGIVPIQVWRWVRAWRHGPKYYSSAIAPARLADPRVLEHLERSGYADYPPQSMRDSELALLAQLDSPGPAVEKTSRAAAGIGMRFPLFDHRLLATCMAIPSHYKVSETHDRRLIREAGRRYVPSEIRLRRDKGYFSPDFGAGMLAMVDQFERWFNRAVNDPRASSLINLEKMKSFLQSMREPNVDGNSDALTNGLLAPSHLVQFLAECDKRV